MFIFSLSVHTFVTGNHYQCRQCDLRFVTKQALKRHIQKHNGTMLNCSHCERLFYDNYDLRKHIEAIPEGRRLLCEECQKPFMTKSGSKRHMQTHTGKFKYTCIMCGRGFAYVHQFQGHVNVHHGLRPHICMRCQASFAWKKDLDFHTSVCGKPKEAVECKVCHKKFKAQKYLTDHMHIHTSPGKYQCTQCGKEYSHRASLKNHEKRKHAMTH